MYSMTPEETENPLPVTSLVPPGFPALPSFYNTNFAVNQHNLTTHHSSPNLMTQTAYPIMNFPAVSPYCMPQWNHQPNVVLVAHPEPLPQRMRTLTSGGVEHNSALTKTKICDHWRRSGICSYGGSCWYAHGEDDLRKVNVTRSGGRMIVEEKSRESEPMKPIEPPKAVLPKRASTNVKGLTVNIPPNIAFKEQVSNNSSLPLSPAQERWISMSGGANPFAEKEQFDGQREEDVMAPLDDYNILSPVPITYQQSGFTGRIAPSGTGASTCVPHSHHHRSFSRGPHPKAHIGNSFGMMPQQQAPTSGHHISRSGSVGGFGAYHHAASTGAAQRSASSIRTSSVSAALPQHITHTGSSPQYQQALWNVAGEISRRQKEVGSSVGSQQRKIDDHADLNRILAQQQAQQQQQAREYEAKMKDINYIKYLLDQGLITKKQIPTEHWNDLVALYNQQQQVHGSSGSDCQCASQRHKEPFHTSSAAFIHPHHHSRRSYMNPHTMAAELSAPPKIFESLLPSDNNFSIWLDPKPKKDGPSAGAALRGGMVSSDSGASLLSKMDHLRSKKFPIDEEEIALATGRTIGGKENHSTSSECSDDSSSSPPVLSLMELLSSENLLEASPGTVQQKARKTTMFDFDALNIVDSLKRMPTPLSVNSKTSNDSTRFAFMIDEKNIGYDDAISGLFTPASTTSGSGSVVGQKASPSFAEPCDFFVAGGSCPFGDSCHMSHSIPTPPSAVIEQQRQKNAAI